ncbi:MAG TPA: amidohydrolase family protein [Burkholderiales bacterium]|jgi:predicted TIM-barrel fold metal-dependent hydrolase|nr:amidohydrolase family protein [Burkholderiales bacterium]
MRAWAVIILSLAFALAARAAELPIFDAHIHYSHDAWETVPPAQAIEILRKAGIKRALVSSSNDDGNQRLLAAAPDLILPSLRPYRTRADVGAWVREDAIVAYLEDHLKKYRYVALGEFHLYGADADLAVPRRMVQLAQQYNLVLHAHSDVDAIGRLFLQYPAARILWAHSGFERPENVREMLKKHKNLWCDLAFRTDHATAGKPSPEWRALFMEFPDRFMLGTDSYVPERWHFIIEHARWARAWLADLPADVAERIAFRNGEALFGPVATPRKP